jgi:cytochrome c oxidase subunit 1
MSDAMQGHAPSVTRVVVTLIVAILLIVLAYGPFFVMYFPARFISPGFTGF